MSTLDNVKHSIKNYLNQIREIQMEFEQLKNNPDLFIFDYFLNLRTNIDIFAEEAICAIQTSQNILIEEIKAYEKECLIKAEELNQNRIKSISNVLDLNLNSRQQILNEINAAKESDLNESELNVLQNNIIEDKKLLIAKIEKFKSDLLLEKNFIVVQKSLKPPSYLFGDLIFTDFYTDSDENDLFSWYKSKNIEKIKIHYYEKLIENVYEEYPNLNLNEILKEYLTQIGLSKKNIATLVRNSKFESWPVKIKTLRNLDFSEYQTVKDENTENIKKIIFAKGGSCKNRLDECKNINEYSSSNAQVIINNYGLCVLVLSPREILYALPVIRCLNTHLDQGLNMNVGYILWFKNVYFDTRF